MGADVRTAKIARKPSAQLPADWISQKVSGELMLISETAARKSGDSGIPFHLSWSHCVFLFGICGHSERRFHEIENDSANEH